MIKNYKIFKESLLDYMKGPTEEEIRSSLSKLPILDWLKQVKILNLDLSYLPSDEVIMLKLIETPIMKRISTVLSLKLDKKFLPTKLEVENMFLESEIDAEDYYKACKILKYDFIPGDIIYKELFTNLYKKYKGDKEKLFNLLMKGVKIRTNNYKYVGFGKESVIFFKFEPETKIIYINPILKLFLLLFTDSEMNEYLNYFIGEIYDSKKLKGNAYFSKLEVGGSWIYHN